MVSERSNVPKVNGPTAMERLRDGFDTVLRKGLGEDESTTSDEHSVQTSAPLALDRTYAASCHGSQMQYRSNALHQQRLARRKRRRFIRKIGVTLVVDTFCLVVMAYLLFESSEWHDKQIVPEERRHHMLAATNSTMVSTNEATRAAFAEIEHEPTSVLMDSPSPDSNAPILRVEEAADLFPATLDDSTGEAPASGEGATLESTHEHVVREMSEIMEDLSALMLEVASDHVARPVMAVVRDPAMVVNTHIVQPTTRGVKATGHVVGTTARTVTKGTTKAAVVLGRGVGSYGLFVAENAATATVVSSRAVFASSRAVAIGTAKSTVIVGRGLAAYSFFVAENAAAATLFVAENAATAAIVTGKALFATSRAVAKGTTEAVLVAGRGVGAYSVFLAENAATAVVVSGKALYSAGRAVAKGTAKTAIIVGNGIGAYGLFVAVNAVTAAVVSGRAAYSTSRTVAKSAAETTVVAGKGLNAYSRFVVKNVATFVVISGCTVGSAGILSARAMHATGRVVAGKAKKTAAATAATSLHVMNNYVLPPSRRAAAATKKAVQKHVVKPIDELLKSSPELLDETAL